MAIGIAIVFYIKKLVRHLSFLLRRTGAMGAHNSVRPPWSWKDLLTKAPRASLVRWGRGLARTCSATHRPHFELFNLAIVV